jgi:hypothetical protein
VVYISPRPDGGVVEGKAAEMAARCAVEGKCAAAREAPAASIACSLGFADAAHVRLDVLIHPEKCQ